MADCYHAETCQAEQEKRIKDLVRQLDVRADQALRATNQVKSLELVQQRLLDALVFVLDYARKDQNGIKVSINEICGAAPERLRVSLLAAHDALQRRLNVDTYQKELDEAKSQIAILERKINQTNNKHDLCPGCGKAIPPFEPHYCPGPDGESVSWTYTIPRPEK